MEKIELKDKGTKCRYCHGDLYWYNDGINKVLKRVDGVYNTVWRCNICYKPDLVNQDLIHYLILMDGKVYGEISTSTEDPSKALQEWMDRIPGIISIPLRRIIEENKGKVTAVRTRDKQ